MSACSAEYDDDHFIFTKCTLRQSGIPCKLTPQNVKYTAISQAQNRLHLELIKDNPCLTIWPSLGVSVVSIWEMNNHVMMRIQLYWLQIDIIWGPFHLHGLAYWGQDKMAAIFQKTFSNAFSWLKMYEFHLRFQCNLFLRVKFNPSTDK